MNQNRLSIIVPTLNEEGNIRELVERVHRALKNKNIIYEIIFVDDHSTDNTREVINGLSAEGGYPIYGYFKVGKTGKAQSILEGFECMRYDLVAILDADLQYPPESLPEMIEKINQGFDVVVANRIRKETSWMRRFISWGFSLFFSKFLHGFDCDVQSGMKMFRKKITEEIKIDPTPWTFDLEFLVKARYYGCLIGSVDIDFVERQSGKTKIIFWKAICEIGVNAIRLKFKKIPPLLILPHKENSMAGAGVACYRNRFITHTTLNYDSSAARTFVPWQRNFIIAFAAVFLFGLSADPMNVGIVLISALSAVYFLDTIFSFYLVGKSLKKPPEISSTPQELAAIDEKSLPVYSIMCPLYKEAHMLPIFFRAIEKIDWPKDKLDILLLLEENDKQTIASAIAMDLPSYVRIIVVPDSLPKTKPKACNYGLCLARGEYAVIYDAEDIPDPMQLKKAFLGFQKVPPEIWCLQAKLNYFNPGQNLLTKLFTAEYSLWFDVILPGLQSINTFIPLGGTSNHFRTKNLLELKGWDPFNVTEDCDLGVRIFKEGHGTAIIDSVTFEEANSDLVNWIRQRSRWVKGYIQTYLVHMRHPDKLVGQIGIDALIFQIVAGAKTIFLFINPFLWLATFSYFAFNAAVGATIEELYLPAVFYIAVFSFVFGNFFYFYCYMIGCAKREQWTLMKYIFLIPFYWALMSVASLVAAYQLIVKPHFWEKTHHGLYFKKSAEEEKAEDFGLADIEERIGNMIPASEKLHKPLVFESVRSEASDEQNSLSGKNVNEAEFLPASRDFSSPISAEPARIKALPESASASARKEAADLSNFKFEVDANPGRPTGQASAAAPPIEKNSSPAEVSIGYTAPEAVPPIGGTDIGNKEKAERSVFKGSFAYLFSGKGLFLAAVLLSNFLNFLFNAFLGRVLDFEALGLVAFVSTFWYVIMFFFGAYSSVLNREIAYLSAAEGKEIGTAFLRSMVNKGLVPIIIIAIVWLAAAPFMSQFFNIGDYAVLSLFAPALIFVFISSANKGFLNGNLYFTSVAIVILAESFTRFFLAAALFYMGMEKMIYATVVVSVIVSSLVSMAIMRTKEAKSGDEKDYAFPKRFFAASLLTSVSTALFLNLDVILVKHFLPPAMAGEYVLLSLVGKMVYFFGSLPNMFMLTFAGRSAGLGQDPEKVFRKIYASAVVLSLVGVLVLGVFGDKTIPFLFGEKALKILPLAIPYVMAMALFTVTSTIVLYRLAQKNYLFAFLSLLFSLLMGAGIFTSHSSVEKIVQVIYEVSVFGWVTMEVLNYLAGRVKSSEIDLSDIPEILNSGLDRAESELSVIARKKILIFNWRDTKHVFAGGAEVYIQEIAKYWASSGNEVTIFCGNDKHSPRKEMIDGVEIIRRGGFYLVYIWAFFYYIFRFRGKYDVIIDCQNGIPFFTPLYAREPVYCLMHHVHQEVFRKSLSKPLALLARFLEKQMMPMVYEKNTFITVSNSSKRDIEDLGLGKAGIWVVNPGIDLKKLVPGKKSGRPTFLYLGRLKAYKSIDVLINAFRIVVQKRPDAVLVIAGSGEEKKNLEKIARSLRLKERQIVFAGKVSEEEKIRLLKRAWVLVNPSLMEGWGIVAIEANACGTPVIASNVPGLRDSVKNSETGYLVEYGNANSFAEHMLKMISDAKMREKMGFKARLWAEDFDWLRSSNDFMAIINNRFKETQSKLLTKLTKA